MLTHCGYEYNSNSRSRGHIGKVTDALMWLYSAGYIWVFEHPVTGDQMCDMDDFKPNQHFNIELTEKAFDSRRNYIVVYLEEYEKLHSLFFDKDFPSYRKLVNLFCFILKSAFVRRQQGVVYHAASIDYLADKNTAGNSSTIYKLLPMLEDMELLHSNSNHNAVKTTAGFAKMSHIFVRHSENWKDELSKAIAVAAIDRKEYLNKGER